MYIAYTFLIGWSDQIPTANRKLAKKGQEQQLQGGSGQEFYTEVFIESGSRTKNTADTSQ